MSTVDYAHISYPESKRLPCPNCGAPVRKSLTFSADVRPGQDAHAIQQSLKDRAWAWKQVPELCKHCLAMGG